MHATTKWRHARQGIVATCGAGWGLELVPLHCWQLHACGKAGGTLCGVWCCHQHGCPPSAGRLARGRGRWGRVRHVHCVAWRCPKLQLRLSRQAEAAQQRRAASC